MVVWFNEMFRQPGLLPFTISPLSGIDNTMLSEGTEDIWILYYRVAVRLSNCQLVYWAVCKFD